MSKDTSTYRCTRNTPYRDANPAPEDLRVRQGHYIVAASPEDAAVKMKYLFPEDDMGFTVTLWSIVRRLFVFKVEEIRGEDSFDHPAMILASNPEEAEQEADAIARDWCADGNVSRDEEGGKWWSHYGGDCMTRVSCLKEVADANGAVDAIKVLAGLNSSDNAVAALVKLLKAGNKAA